jgi:hypothetical protein
MGQVAFSVACAYPLLTVGSTVDHDILIKELYANDAPLRKSRRDLAH